MRAGSSLVLVAALCAHAVAEPSYREVREAGTLFDRGRAQLAAGDTALACASFARSHQLDPQLGTLYNLAGCYAKRGMLVSAWAAYRDLAAHDRNPKRRADATERARQLEATVPRLQITTPMPGWRVTLNGADVSGRIGVTEPVDPGAYEVIATAPGEPAFRTTVTLVADGKATTVAVRSKRALDVADPFSLDAGASRPVVHEHRATATVDPVRKRKRLYATLALGGGGAFLLGGLVLGKQARDTWGEAKALCGDDLRCDTATDLARGDELVDRARSRGHAATGLVIGGLALGGFGAWLYWKSTKHEVVVRPGTSASPAGVTIGGRF